MARMWTCGFELQSTSAEFGVNSGVIVTGSPSISTTVHRAGTASLRINSSAATQFVEHQITTGVVMRTLHRLYLRVATLPDTATNIYGIGQSGYFPALLRLQTDGTLVLRDGFTETTLTGTSAALTTGRWYRVELDYTDVSGTLTSGVSAFKGYLDGVQFSNAMCSNINGFSRIRMGVQLAATTDFYMDDIAINDTTGSAQTGLPGPGSVVHLRPNAAGDNNGWATAVGGTAGASNNYTRVSERTPDDATSYNQTTATGTTTIDDFNVEDRATAGIGSSDTITLVQVGGRVASDNTTAASIVYRLKGQASGTVQESASVTVANTSWSVHAGQSPRPYQLTAYVNPQGSAAWTPSALDGIQIGVRGDVSQTTVRRVSTLWALVDFQPLTTAALTLASETDTGQALSKTKTRALGVASETDTAQALTRHKTRLLGIASETNAAQAIGHTRSRALPLAAETDASQPVGRRKTGALGTAADTEAAQSLARTKRQPVGVAAESAAARPVGQAKRAALAVAAETGQALALAPAAGLQQATETSTARALGRAKTTTLGVAGEVEEARLLGRAKAGGLAVAAEIATARPLTGGHTQNLTLVEETCTARLLPGAKAQSLGRPTEASEALTLAGGSIGALFPGVEEDTARPVTGRKTRTLPTASAVESAQPVTGRKTTAVSPALASDAARPLARAKGALLGPAGETAEAQRLVVPGTAAPAEETSAARPLAKAKRAPLPAALVVEEAQQLGTQSLLHLSYAAETVAALPAGQRKAYGLLLVAVVHTAWPLGAGKTLVLATAQETCRALIGPKIRLTQAIDRTEALALTGHRQRPADQLDATTSDPGLTPSASGPDLSASTGDALALSASTSGPLLAATSTGG